MRFELITSRNSHILQVWINNPVIQNLISLSNAIKTGLLSEAYYLYLDEPVGIFTLSNILPGESAEFGAAILDNHGLRVVIKAAIVFLKAAFYECNFKFIYINPLTEQSKKAAFFIGFEDNKITLEQLERKWSR